VNRGAVMELSIHLIARSGSWDLTEFALALFSGRFLKASPDAGLFADDNQKQTKTKM